MRSSSPMSICAFCRECSCRWSSCDAADRLVRNRDQRTDALIVACDHRGVRSAVVKQDFPSRAVSQVSPARSAATAVAVSFCDPSPTCGLKRWCSAAVGPVGRVAAARDARTPHLVPADNRSPSIAGRRISELLHRLLYCKGPRPLARRKLLKARQELSD